MRINLYETLFILKPTLTDEEKANEIATVENLVKELGGEVSATNELGMRKLAYEINKNPRGFYVVVYHKSPASAISEIERKLRYNENVLRFLTIKYKTKKEQAKFEEFVAQITGKAPKDEAKEEASNQETAKEETTQEASE